jgi:uncharacterized iron-regulated membrane protein
MKIWTEWVDSPQHIWLRRAMFQIHLWSGIGLGLYVVVISLSGSAAVFNRELYTAFLPPPKMVNVAGTRMTRAELKSAAQKAHPGANIARIALPVDPHYAATITLGVGANAPQRLFDPYTGLDIGNARPFGLRMVSFFSQLHMNLLMDYTGRMVNGVAGFLTTALTLTGMIIWWPEIRRWRDSLTIRWDANLKRLNWSLHNAIGFWTSAIVLMWAVTGAYLVFPKPFSFLIDSLAGRPISLGQMPHSIHVGDFGGWPVKALWVALGLVPPALFVTGFVMWWDRVVQPFMRMRSRRAASASTQADFPIPEPLFETDRVGQP